MKVTMKQLSDTLNSLGLIREDYDMPNLHGDKGITKTSVFKKPDDDMFMIILPRIADNKNVPPMNLLSVEITLRNWGLLKQTKEFDPSEAFRKVLEPHMTKQQQA